MLLCIECDSGSMEIEAAVIGAIVGAIISGGFLIFVWHRQKQQQFEITFFNLLSSLRDMVYNTTGEIKSNTKKNSDVYSATSTTTVEKGVVFYKRANKMLQEYIADNMGKMVMNTSISSMNDADRLKTIKDFVKEAYNDFFSNHTSELANYLRFSYNIVSFVASHPDLGYSDKKKYINIIQAQMSSDELSILFFNGIGNHGGKFYNYIEEFNFLQNIDKNVVPYLEVYSAFYPKSSFRFKNRTAHPLDDFLNALK